MVNKPVVAGDQDLIKAAFDTDWHSSDTSARQDLVTRTGQHSNSPDVADEWVKNVVAPKVPSWKPAPVTLVALQEWEGYVTDIREEEFDARLTDLTAQSPVETDEVTVPMEEISPEDRRKVQLGAFFRWVIGYERSLGGTQKRVSVFVFLDLPVMTERDWEHARSWAREIRKAIVID